MKKRAEIQKIKRHGRAERASTDSHETGHRALAAVLTIIISLGAAVVWFRNREDY